MNCRDQRDTNWRPRALHLVAVPLLFGLLGAAGCGDEGGDGGNASPTSSGAAGSTDGTEPDQPPAEQLSLSVAVTIAAPSQAHAYLAELAGYYEDENLEVDVQLATGTAAVNLVVAGQADVAVMGLGSSLGPADQGQPTSVIMANTGGSAGNLTARAGGATRPEECEKVTASAFGTTGYAWAVNYASHFDAGWEVVPFPDGNDAVNTVIAGNADCNVGALGFIAAAVDRGDLEMLIDARDEGSLPREQAFVEASVWGLTDNLTEKHEAVVRFVRAWQRAQQLIDDSTSEELADMLLEHPDWAPMDRDQLIKLIEDTRPFLQPNGGFILEEEWDANMQFYAQGGLDFIDVSDPVWSFDERVEMSYLEEAIE